MTISPTRRSREWRIDGSHIDESVDEQLVGGLYFSRGGVMRSGFETRRTKILLAMSLAFISVSAGDAQKVQGASYEAGLVRCVDVNQPTTLAHCGTDSFQGGSVEISEAGEVEVTIMQAVPNVTYDVVYRSLNGSTERPIGQLRTDARGTGSLDIEWFFASNHVGSGNIVLKRGGLDQFLTGFKVLK